MYLVGVLPSSTVQSAAIAYAHYISFMLCFAALALERVLIKEAPSRKEAISILVVDVIYGLAGLILLGSGILRVLYFGQGSSFYTENPLFWIKVGLFILVGILSLYPTVTYILWARPLSKQELPTVPLAAVNRIRKIINVELIGFAIIPSIAVFMARGYHIPFG